MEEAIKVLLLEIERYRKDINSIKEYGFYSSARKHIIKLNGLKKAVELLRSHENNK